MASKLLNVLNDVEKGRQNCIEELNSHGFDVPIDTSINNIAEYLDSAINTDNIAITIPGTEDDDYTPENDPEVWHRPNEWPDIKSIFKAQEDIVVGNTTYIPAYIMLLKNDTAITTFTLSPGSSQYVELEEGNIYIGTNSYNNGKYYYIRTSDDALFPINVSNSTNTHTWDTSKDIIVAGDVYRYVIVYVTSAISYTSQYLNLSGLKVVELVCTYCVGLNGGTLPLTLKSIVFTQCVTQTIPSVVKTCWLQYINMQVETTSMLYNKSNIENIEIEEGLTTLNIDMPSGKWTSNISTFKAISLSYLNNFISPSIVYLGVPAWNGISTYSNSSSNVWNDEYKLKYWIVNDEQLASKTIFYGLSNCIHLKQPSIPHILSVIKTLGPSVGNQCSLKNCIEKYKVINLSNLITITNPDRALNETCCDTLIAPNVITNNVNLGESYFKKIIAPSVTEISGRSFWLTNTCMYYDLSGVRSITTNYVNMDLVQYLDLSSLESLAYEGVLAGKRLRVLKLKDGFKFNINLKNSSLLTRDCILDIINKAATLEEGEVYTFTLPYGTDKKLTAEEIAVLTNKGWTVA